MLLRAEPIFVAKGLVVADHRDPADRIMIIKTGVVELCLAIDSKVYAMHFHSESVLRTCRCHNILPTKLNSLQNNIYIIEDIIGL